jgi:hypothetical protein
MIPILVYLDIPSDYISQAKYVFGFFSNFWGISVKIVDHIDESSSVYIHYGSRDSSILREKTLFVPFDASLYDSHTVCFPTECGGRILWGRLGTPPSMIDLVAASFRLLTLMDEQQIALNLRDRRGNFLVSALPKGRRSTIDLPLLDHQALFLQDKLFDIIPGLRSNIMPRWPDGKKYAVCLSHDCDLIHIGHPRELAVAVVKSLVRRKKVYFDMALCGVRYLHSIMESPFWGFNGWAKYEMTYSMRSCFYFAVAPRKSFRRFNDCKSDVFSRGVDWKVFQSMHKQGWEFGLHPSIDAQKDLEEIVLQKKAVEERLEAPLMGLRHHYLAIDHFNAHNTFRKHVEAGFSYDTSLGWHEKAGFRAGTTLPYYPYDPLYKIPFPLIELPLSLMDTYIMNIINTDQAIKAGREIASVVSVIGGMLMLNWHAETYFSKYIYANYLMVLQSILEPLISDADAWIATPLEIVKWWNYRNHVLKSSLTV